MKKIIFLGACVALGLSASAQFYSNGINIITGSNIGIGTATPIALFHMRGAMTPATEMRVQHTNLTAGSSRISFFNDTATAFTSTANYAVFNKYAAGVTGAIAPNFNNSKLFAFNNAQGDMIFSTGGNVGFGFFNQGTSQASPRLLIHSNGKVGIGGNEIPAANAHVNATTTGDTLKITNSYTGHSINDGLDIRTMNNAASIMNRENSSLSLGTNNTTRFNIDSIGNVVIGTASTPAGYKLFVETGILTEKVKVAVKTSSNWADYVFAKDYHLSPLNEVENYILENKHLPGIPAADEVVSEGLDLGKMDAKLLEKIEELTLHLIRMEKEIKALQIKNTLLETKISSGNK